MPYFWKPYKNFPPTQIIIKRQLPNLIIFIYASNLKNDGHNYVHILYSKRVQKERFR